MMNMKQEQNTLKLTALEINNAKSCYQAGLSAIEMIVGIGVIAIITALVLGLSGPIMTTLRTNSMVSELTTFQQKIHEVYNGQQDGYTGISAKELISSKAYPGSLNATSNSLTSSFAGKVTISSDDGSGTAFSIQYDSVPTGVCIATTSKMASVGGWNEVDIGGSPIWAGTSAMPKKSDIDAACSAKANVAMKFISN